MSTLVVDRDLNGVPKPIVEKLRSVVKRARTVLLVRGIMAVFSVALLALLVGMAIDSSFTIFSTAIRAAISLSLLAVVLVSAYYFLIRPLLRTFDLTGVARIIETRHPELEERISSAVELLTSKDVSEIRGSEVLIAEVAKQAVGQVGTVSPKKEFSFTVARPYFIAAGIFTMILLLLFVFDAAATSQLLKRVVAPFANIGNVQATSIVVVPGDQVIAEGDSLRIEVTVPNERVEIARLRRKSGNSETAERMKSLSADAEGYPRFFLSIPAVSEDFQYRVHAGGALTRYYNVQVVPRPVVEQFELVYHYPSYMSRRDRTVTSDSGNVEGPIGSLVTIVAKTNTKIEKANLTIAGMPGKDAIIRSDEEAGVSFCEWQIDLTDDLIVGRTWSLRLQDEHNFMNWPTEYTIKAVPDKSPTIVIREPVDRRLRMKATDSLPIHYRAEDDVEVAKTELIASVDGRDEIARSIAIPPDADRTSFNSVTNFDLSELAGKGAQTIKVHLRVTDSLPSDLEGPQLALSDVITITLDETADTYFEKRAAKDYASIREALQRVLVELQQADQQTSGLDQVVMPEGRLAEQVSERIDQVRELTSQAEQDLRDLSEVLPSTSFVSLQPEVDDLAETDVTSARDQAGLIKLSDAPAQRTEHALASDRHVEQSIARTEELIKNLDDLWEQIQKIADLQDLADRQESIAEQIANVKFENFPELPITEQQLEVADEIAETIKATPQVLQDLLQEHHQQAEDLVQAAEQLAEQQTELAELTETSNQPNVDLEELRDQIAEAIAKEQRQIAEEAAALDQEIENAEQAGEDQQSNLAEKPAEAASEIAQGDLSQAAEDAEVAAEQFEQAAEALENSQPVPDGASSEDENGQPQEGQPEGGEPENGQPQEGQPEGGEPENGQPQEGQPEGGEPENGQPQEGQPEGGEPENGQPQEGQPEGGEPENGQPQEGQPEGGEPENGQPQEGQPEGGEPENGQPQEGQPEGGEPENGQPQEGQPEGGEPENGQPQEGQPEGGEPENGQPQEGQPEGGEPENGQPQEGQPEGGEPENGQPQEGQPEGGEPENGQPQNGDPEKNAQLAQKAAELAQRQEKVAEQLEALNEGDLDQALEMIQEQVAQDAAELSETAESVAQLLELLDQPQEAQASAQQATAELESAAENAQEALDQIAQASGEPAEGEPAEGQPEGGKPAEGQPEGGEPAEGQPEGGEPAEGQPEGGEPAEGQPEGGEPAEGQPEGGEPAEGQPEGGEPAEGQPEGGEPAGQGQGEPESGEPTAETGQPAKQQAVQAQQQAAQALENAARALENVANNIEAQANAIEADAQASLSPTEAAGGELGDALEAAAEAIAALQSNSTEDASAQAAAAQAESAQAAQAQAAEGAQQAAQALAQAAQAAAEQAGVPTETSASESGQQPAQGEQGQSQNGQSQNNQPSPSNQQGQNGQSQQPSSQIGQGTSEQGLRGGTMDNELEQKLKEYGISSTQWTRLPGSLKNQIRQAEAEGVPEEYRTMVRRYFRELAAKQR